MCVLLLSVSWWIKFSLGLISFNVSKGLCFSFVFNILIGKWGLFIVIIYYLGLIFVVSIVGGVWWLLSVLNLKNVRLFFVSVFYYI